MATAVFESLSVDPATFERLTGWSMRPEGLCRGERCVPLAAENGRVDVRVFAQRTSSALVHDAENGLWALGPESGGRALASGEGADSACPCGRSCERSCGRRASRS